MNAVAFNRVQHNVEPPFDLVRLSKSKQSVDLCSNTIRAFFTQGLPCYPLGKMRFFSRAELAEFIKNRAQK
jgi:hypothetical protein